METLTSFEMSAADRAVLMADVEASLHEIQQLQEAFKGQKEVAQRLLKLRHNEVQAVRVPHAYGGNLADAL